MTMRRGGRLCEVAAEAGNPPAMFMVASRGLEGDPSGDIANWIKLLEKAATAGHGPSMLMLAQTLAEALTKDEQLSDREKDVVYWMRRAHCQGEAAAAKWLQERGVETGLQWDVRPQVQFGPVLFGKRLSPELHEELGLRPCPYSDEAWDSEFYPVSISCDEDVVMMIELREGTSVTLRDDQLMGSHVQELSAFIEAHDGKVVCDDHDLVDGTIEIARLGLDLEVVDERIVSVTADGYVTQEAHSE